MTSNSTHSAQKPFWPLTALRRLRIRERSPWLFHLLDGASIVPTALASAQLRLVRRIGVEYLPLTRATMHNIGIIPTVDHYYDPFIAKRHLSRELADDRLLPGLDLRQQTYKALFEELSSWRTEPLEGPVPGRSDIEYRMRNGTYGGYDAALLHAFIRKLKPRRVLEVGSGNSTKVAIRALAQNQAEGTNSTHRCIEPFEMPWLERTGIDVIRKKAEDVGTAPFRELRTGDLLFVDNSHTIRPQGDVLFIVQQVLPILAPGVTVHIHDLFTPADYPSRWILDRMLLWNEQYIVESFLTHNSQYEVLLAAHHAFRRHPEYYERLRPGLGSLDTMAPTGFWIRRTEP